jgi:hypothetical protein
MHRGHVKVHSTRNAHEANLQHLAWVGTIDDLAQVPLIGSILEYFTSMIDDVWGMVTAPRR